MTRHNRAIFTVIFALTAATGVACVEDYDDFEDDEFRIINGDPASSSVTEYAATIGIHTYNASQGTAGASPFCSGTLISDEVVLTAAHCCDTAQGGTSFKTMAANSALVYFGDGPAHNGTNWTGDLYLLSEVVIHPSYNRQQLNNDICLLRLSTPNNNVTPIAHMPGSEAVQVGDTLDHVGFGYSNVAKTQYGVKLHAELPVGATSATKLTYNQPYAGPCNGDSGGPAFIDRNGSTYVAGITSYGDAACTDYGVSTNVANYDGWINDFIGGGGGGGGSCGDNVCDVGESCDGRYGTSSCSSDCPGKTNGKASSQYCYVDGVCEGPGC